MSKKFYAVNRQTGERWKPEKKESSAICPFRQYLVMYDSGYLAVVTEEFYVYIQPLDPTEWKIVHRISSPKENKQ